MGRKALSAEKIAQIKENLFVVSNRMIAETGIEKLSIRLLCEQSGISYSSFYNYYNSKDELILAKFAVVDAYLEESVALLHDEDNIKNVIQFITLYVKLTAKSNPMVIREIYRSQLKEYSAHPTLKTRSLYTLLIRILENGQAANQIRKDFSLDELLHMIFSYTKGMIFEWCLSNFEYDIQAFCEKTTPVWISFLRV